MSKSAIAFEFSKSKKREQGGVVSLPLARAVAGVDHFCWRRTLIPLMNQLISARTAPEFESLFEEFRGLFDRTCREAQLSAQHHIELLYENVSWLRSHGEHVHREIRER